MILLNLQKLNTIISNFFESFEFDKLMQQLRGWMRSIFEEGPNLREEMVSIINLLEEEIKKHN